jgi:hypothetical protein
LFLDIDVPAEQAEGITGLQLKEAFHFLGVRARVRLLALADEVGEQTKWHVVTEIKTHWDRIKRRVQSWKQALVNSGNPDFQRIASCIDLQPYQGPPHLRSPMCHKFYPHQDLQEKLYRRVAEVWPRENNWTTVDQLPALPEKSWDDFLMAPPQDLPEERLDFWTANHRLLPQLTWTQDLLSFDYRPREDLDVNTLERVNNSLSIVLMP